MTTARFAIALTGDQVIRTLARPDLVTALSSSGADFVVLGADRIDRRLPLGRRTIDGAIAAAFLAGHGVRGVLATAALEREHPYTIARTIASLDHQAGGTGGVVLGLHDRFAHSDARGASPTDPAAVRGWAGAGLDAGVPLDHQTLDDAGRILHELWQSWPIDSVIANRETGVFTRADEIRRIDHTGVYDVAGPLGVPSTPQGAPVLARYVHDVSGASALSRDVDLALVSMADSPQREHALTALARREALAVFVTADVDDADAVAAAIDAVESGRCGGVLLSAAGGTAVDEQLDALTRALAEQSDDRAVSGTLRERLGLPGPRPLLTAATRAFPAPLALR